jgi:hypothetical protein
MAVEIVFFYQVTTQQMLEMFFTWIRARMDKSDHEL